MGLSRSWTDAKYKRELVRKQSGYIVLEKSEEYRVLKDLKNKQKKIEYQGSTYTEIAEQEAREKGALTGNKTVWNYLKEVEKNLEKEGILVKV